MSLVSRINRCKVNSLLYWYPKIKNSLTTPQTVIIKLPKGWLDWLDSGTPKDFAEILKTRAKPLGFPLFMRTDQMAAKHSWSETCFVEKKEYLSGQVRNLLEENMMCDMVGEAVPSAIVLRKFLHLETAFIAFKGMPIAREFRLFAEDGAVLCIHPYWPPESIEFFSGTKEPEDWKQKLVEISKPCEHDLKNLQSMASAATKILGGYWSVDLCKTQEGYWVLTDMASGYDSFHWEGCRCKKTE